MSQKKVFKYIDGNLHGYTPINEPEASELKGAGWNTDANKSYADMGKYPAESDNDFRVDINVHRQSQARG